MADRKLESHRWMNTLAYCISLQRSTGSTVGSPDGMRMSWSQSSTSLHAEPTIGGSTQQGVAVTL